METRILLALLLVALLSAGVGLLAGWQAHRVRCQRKYGSGGY